MINLLFGDIDIILVEEVDAENKMQLRKLENEYIQKEFKNVLCLNTLSAVFDQVNDITKNKLRCKKYYENNKEHALQQSKLYKEQHKEYYTEYMNNYYENNKDKICYTSKLYNKEHKESIKKKRELKIQCICGKEYTILHKTRHEQSKFHQNYINNLNN